MGMRVRTLRHQHGQTSVEYVGVLLIVVAVVAVLLSAGIGEAVGAKVEQAICAVLTDRGLGECAGGTSSPGGEEPGVARDAGLQKPLTGREGRGMDSVAAERAALPATQVAALVPASASGGAETCFASSSGCDPGPKGAIVEPGPDVAPEAEQEGGFDEAFLGPPEGNWILQDGKLVQLLENGVGGGAIRALGRVVGLGAKALNAAKARVARLGMTGVGAQGLLASERAARTQAAALQGMLPKIVRERYVTMGVGIGRDSSGALRVVVGQSGRAGPLHPAVREAVQKSGAIVARGPKGKADAEIRILEHMAANGLRPVTVAAGRPICPQCAAAIARARATAASRLKEAPLSRPASRPPNRRQS